MAKEAYEEYQRVVKRMYQSGPRNDKDKLDIQKTYNDRKVHPIFKSETGLFSRSFNGEARLKSLEEDLSESPERYPYRNIEEVLSPYSEFRRRLKIRTESLCRRRNESPVSILNLQANIQERILFKMPSDFFDLWEFCSEIDHSLTDITEVFADLGLHLVGPYDVLSQKISDEDYVGVNILCHYRFYYDPPEFQTVIVRNGDDLYHIGYFRDDPSEMPFGLASNSAAVGPKLKLVGDNIFAALNFELNAALKTAGKNVKGRFKNIQKNLKEFAKMRNYSLECETPKTEARNRKVNAKTFHGLGIVVPYDEVSGIGYRALGVTNAKLKSILKKISDCQAEDKKLSARSELDEILVCLQFANDECDYGMGLELGIDLFCFGDPYLHKDILMVLKLAYNLLDRPLYSRIIEAHLSQRR